MSDMGETREPDVDEGWDPLAEGGDDGKPDLADGDESDDE